VLAAGAVGHQLGGKTGFGQALAQVMAGFGLVFDDQQFHGQLLAAGHVRLYTVVARGGRNLTSCNLAVSWLAALQS